MPTDRYTKVVLTVIAIALVCTVVQNASAPVHAQPAEIQKVQICDALGGCANLIPHKQFGIPSLSLSVTNEPL